MKKFCILAVLICLSCCFAPHLSTYAQDTTTFVVSANTADVFQAPSFTAQKVEKLTCNQEVEIVLDGQAPKQFFGEGFMFYQTQNGYILAELVVPKNSQITSIPNFNAKTKETCTVYFLQNSQFVESDITLQKGTQLFLYEGFKSKQQYTAVAFIYNKNVCYGYISTKTINPDGINPTIIVCACTILAVLGIVFAWLFMRRKKSKKSLA